MQLISKFNKGFMLLAWIFPLKDKKGITLPMIFRKLLKKLIENQTKYGLIKAVNFTIAQ